MFYNNINFYERNRRIHSDANYAYLLWELPSRITCPYSTPLCKRKCFARNSERFPQNKQSRVNNYEQSLLDTFETTAIEAITHFIHLEKNIGKSIIVRLHTSGDFYSQHYFDKWVRIANHFKETPHILFQAFTKSVRYLEKYDLKEVNIHFVYSVWNDTKAEELAIAKKLDLPLYWTKPKEEVAEAEKQGIYICPKTTNGSCKECYQCHHKLIISEYN